MSLAHIGFFLRRLAGLAGETSSFGSRFLSSAFVLGAGIAAWRLVTLSMNVAEADEIFDRSLIQQAYLGAFSLGILGLSIGFILIANERLREELEYLATRDPMTGTLNRRLLRPRRCRMARSARSKRPLAVIASDIDFFKDKTTPTATRSATGDQDCALRAGHMLRLPTSSPASAASS